MTTRWAWLDEQIADVDQQVDNIHRERQRLDVMEMQLIARRQAFRMVQEQIADAMTPSSEGSAAPVSVDERWKLAEAYLTGLEAPVRSGEVFEYLVEKLGGNISRDQFLTMYKKYKHRLQRNLPKGHWRLLPPGQLSILTASDEPEDAEDSAM